ncbi:class I adenylate-forming enzyme family protein [Mycolicibacterium fortuitum]|uniref:class I adenylate-forming enzyme family protein n=1 Tax=Mycolicibacterium fortuitum TaxID=1766 RepID=UPI0007EA6BC0|nr:class I adenylate-forming enzyme family protein [Mycolicibacterium fortuitum]OBB22982.1 AMP-binding protein [Mycolicibacterium fortuitum]OBB51483.1 AMP-binding protein [Mycolicibacterium fortuitum]OBB70416.1 AMP-binding protein [Mycolicibacterium fortuitum]OBF84184.1 AMP-binding protein [Mycolicibacterium fortuitum]OBG24279.1 AMP-binding protein [Mycolicibacterium fortuitum]
MPEPPDTIDALLRHHGASAKPMVIDPDTRISYAELDSSTRELASGLMPAGVGKGARVGLIMPNCTDWVRIALAVTRIGAVLVPLSTLLTGRELTAQLRTASVQYLIAVEEFRGRRYPHGPVPSLRRTWTPEEVLAFTGSAALPTVRPSDPLVIMFTSGSSGAPKAVVHSHANALGAVRSGLGARCITDQTRLYLPMPFFWVGGFAAGVLSALVAGATLITEPVPDPESTLKLLEREQVTLFRGWPAQAEALARHPASAALSALGPGSLEALLPAHLRAEPGARASLFGMTESFGPYCGYPADTDMPRSAWGSCGRPFPGMDVRIVDTATGVMRPAGVTGEIQIRGRHVMRGICRRSREEVFTPDGYYPTGDLGYLDDDGFLFYRGRSDDMFKVSGATVYPSEVQRALRSLPGVRAAHVVNVPDGQTNRVGAALVGDGLSADSLRSAVRDVLSSFKVPTLWLLLEDEHAVPHGATGKVDNAALRVMVAEGDRRMTD